MIATTIIDNFSIPKSRYLITRKMIVQKGPLLYDFDSLKKTQEDLKIGIKKITLEQRPDSSSSLTQRKGATPKQRSTLPEAFTGKHKQGNPSIFRKFIRFEENPFQNEALQFPFSKRSFSATRRIKRNN